MNAATRHGVIRRIVSFPLFLCMLLLPVVMLFATLLTAGAGVAFAGLPGGAGSSSGPAAPGNGPAQGTPTPTATCTPGWTIYPNPAPPGESVLNAVTATGPNDLWAVGSYGSTVSHTLTLHGDGASWTQVPSPNPGSGNVVLSGVSGVAHNDVWAVGSYQSGNAWRTLTMHWDGTAWTIVPSPNGSLKGVAAVAAGDVWAVGNRTSTTLFAHYNDPCGGATGTPTSTPTRTPTPTCVARGTPGPWTARANYPEEILGLAVASDGTNLYGFAGRGSSRQHTSYKYNYATDTWTAIPTIPAGAGTGAEAEYGHNGKIYVMGGTAEAQSANRIYDIASNTWTLGAEVPAMVSDYGHAYWNGKIYVIGGGYYWAPINGVYAYDIASDTWSTLAPLPRAEYGMATAAINGKIYVANGGTGGSGVVTNTLYVYDINTNTWSQGPPSPLASSDAASTAIGDKLYMIGGSTPGQTAQTYLYDPVSNSWSAGPNLNYARRGSGAATINTPGGEMAVVVGGCMGAWCNRVEASTAPFVQCATATATPPTGTPIRTPSRSPVSTPPALTNTPISTGTATPCPLPFTDVNPSDYFYPAVRHLYCYGAVSGYADGTFRPYDNSTRGQLAKIVVLAQGWTIYTPSTPTFRDVPADNPFYQHVETAYSRAVISGYSCGTGCLEFRPGNNVTRGQLSKILVLAQGWPLYTPPVPTSQDVPADDPFYAHIETAYSHNVISGYSCGDGCLEFRPGNTATRGQICKIVYLAVTQP